MKKIFIFFIFISALFFLYGCCGMDTADTLNSGNSQVITRNMQSRSFDTRDRTAVMQALVSALLDRGYIINQASGSLGTVSADSFEQKGLTVTVSVRQSGSQTVVRVNARNSSSSIKRPEWYQDFFNSLSQSLFLEAHEVQ